MIKMKEQEERGTVSACVTVVGKFCQEMDSKNTSAGAGLSSLKLELSMPCDLLPVGGRLFQCKTL